MDDSRQFVILAVQLLALAAVVTVAAWPLACGGRRRRLDLLATAVGEMPSGQPDSTKHKSRVAWYRNSGEPASQKWQRHIIEDRLPAAVHGHPVDLDADGDLDVVMAHGMRVEADPTISRHQVVWYENRSKGQGIPGWRRHHVGNAWKGV